MLNVCTRFALRYLLWLQDNLETQLLSKATAIQISLIFDEGDPVMMLETFRWSVAFIANKNTSSFVNKNTSSYVW